MNNYVLYGGVAIIIVLLIAIVFLICSRSKKVQSTSPMTKNSDVKKEMKRRQIAADRIQQRIEKEMIERKGLLDKLRISLKNKFRDEKKTLVDLNIKTSRSLFQELQGYFELHNSDEVYYCRRYCKVFGTDNFFIITRTGFAYAPKKRLAWQLNFEDVKSLSTSDMLISFNKNSWGDCAEAMECYDFIYDSSKLDDLVTILNKFLDKYRDELSILYSGAWEAIEEVALPILPNIIEKIGLYDVNDMKFFRAYYKYLLARDGVDTKQNIQRALYDLKDLYNKNLKDGDTQLLEAKLLLLDPETDNIEVKRLLDEICGNDEYDNDIKDQAMGIKIKLEI